MANLNPEQILDKFGTKRQPRTIIQTYRIRGTKNHSPRYPGSLDQVLYVLLFPKKLFKGPELYIYNYLPTYEEDPDPTTGVRTIKGLEMAEVPLMKYTDEFLEDRIGKDYDELLTEGEPVAMDALDALVREFAAKSLYFLDEKTEYEIVQSPWQTDYIPPEPAGEELKNVEKEEPQTADLQLTQAATTLELRIRGEYTLQMTGEETLKIIGPRGSLVQFPDGSLVDIGELTLVKQEDPSDPDIITIINPEEEINPELDPEYVEDAFTYDEGEIEFQNYAITLEKPSPQDLADIQISAGTPVVLGGDADFWALAAICTLEAGSPQPRADVAQSIYNRLATPGTPYGSSLKAIITAAAQYEPALIPGGKGAVRPEWKAIKNRATAIAAVVKTKGFSKEVAGSHIDETIAALRDTKLQEEARKHVGTRTEFLAYYPKSKGAKSVKHRSTKYVKTANGGNNYFFWLYAGKKLIGQNPPGAPDFSNLA